MIRASKTRKTMHSGAANYVFVGTMDCVKTLTDILKTLELRERATFIISSIGIKIITEEQKAMQTISYLQREQFQEFEFPDDDTVFSFDINISILMEYLELFSDESDTTSLKMCYAGDGHPLVLFMEQSGVVANCKISTMESSDTLLFDWEADKLLNRIIMDSNAFMELWSDLDDTSTTLEVMMSPKAPFFELKTDGYLIGVTIAVDKTSEYVTLFDCTQTQRHKYNYRLLKPIEKILVASEKVAFRTDDTGVLSLQFLLRINDRDTYVEYYCIPLVDEDDL